MKAVLLLIAALMLLIGLTGVFWPAGLIPLVNYSFTPQGIWVSAIARMAFGAALLFGAHATRTPRTVRVMGTIIFLAGVATALVGAEQAQALKDWWITKGGDALRIAACLPLAAGCFIGWTTMTRKPRL
jgi:hypothetical protein